MTNESDLDLKLPPLDIVDNRIPCPGDGALMSLVWWNDEDDLAPQVWECWCCHRRYLQHPGCVPTLLRDHEPQDAEVS